MCTGISHGLVVLIGDNIFIHLLIISLHLLHNIHLKIGPVTRKISY